MLRSRGGDIKHAPKCRISAQLETLEGIKSATKNIYSNRIDPEANLAERVHVQQDVDGLLN